MINCTICLISSHREVSSGIAVKHYLAENNTLFSLCEWHVSRLENIPESEGMEDLEISEGEYFRRKKLEAFT